MVVIDEARNPGIIQKLTSFPTRFGGMVWTALERGWSDAQSRQSVVGQTGCDGQVGGRVTPLQG